MADTPISGLPIATSVSSNDVVPIVQAGVTRQATASQIVAAAKSNRDEVHAGAAADQQSTSTPTTITYSTPFNTATTVIRGLVFANYTGTDFPVWVYQISNVTKNGFSILVGGGQSGKTVDIHYSVIGN